MFVPLVSQSTIPHVIPAAIRRRRRRKRKLM
jgi:hypothetical protein